MKPDDINRSSIREYVNASERIYAWNLKYEPDQVELYVYLNGIKVSSRNDGYVVHVDEVRISQRFEDNSIGDDAWSAHYFVNDSVVRRGQGHAGGPVPNESEWRTIRCW